MNHINDNCGCLSSDRTASYVHGLSLMPRDDLPVSEGGGGKAGGGGARPKGGGPRPGEMAQGRFSDDAGVCEGSRAPPLICSSSAFRHNAPGFCPVCRVDMESALDVHMTGSHLELGSCGAARWSGVRFGMARLVTAWDISTRSMGALRSPG